VPRNKKGQFVKGGRAAKSAGKKGGKRSGKKKS
jgi:hypothetical protein